jgi:hypothetical protein
MEEHMTIAVKAEAVDGWSEHMIIGDDSEAAYFAVMAPTEPITAAAMLTMMPAAEHNDWCRSKAMQIMEEFGPYLSKRERKLCRSLAAQVERRRRVRMMVVRELFDTTQNAARRLIVTRWRALTEEQRSLRIADVVPANTLAA